MVASIIGRHVGEGAAGEREVVVVVVQAEREGLGRPILVGAKCWSEGAVKVRRRGVTQPVLLGCQNKLFYWSWRARAQLVLHEIAVVLAQVEEW